MYRRSRDGGMGYLPQDRSVFQKLSVQNNLFGVMEMLGMKKAERKLRCEELLEKFHLTHLRQSYGGSLSGGERRRLEIARSLVSNPKIILLDEPFAAVDPVTVASIQEIIRKLAAEGIAILITDHSVQDTLEITKRSYVIQAGKVLCHGNPEEVLANPEARKVYFGEKQDKFRADAHAESHGHKKHAHHNHHHSHRKVDPDWEVPPTEIILKEKEQKHAPISDKSRPFHLQFHTSANAPPAVPKVESPPVVQPVPPQAVDSPMDSGVRKRLRPISSSITPDVTPVFEEPVRSMQSPQDDPNMSSIIRNLGQMIWKK
jgi:LPS export ABC transporter ATP-binding protein